MSEHVEARLVSQAVLVHDSKTLQPEFIHALEQVLSSSLTVERLDLSKRSKHSPLSLPWLEIALLFASTAIATSILSKIGEDIYDEWFKGKIAKAIAKKKDKKTGLQLSDAMRLTFTINASELLVQGRVMSENYETIVEAIGAAQQMIIDAKEKQESEIEQIRQDPRLYREWEGVAKQTPVFQAGLWFEYEYDASEKRWRIRWIHLYKPDAESGGFTIVAGEPDRVIM